MPISLYNTLTQRVDEFVPLQAGKVSLYVCGSTVQDVAHAGHARTYSAFDLLTRFFRARGFDVTYVRNITDVDDKILAKAKESGEPPMEYSARMAKLHDDDIRAIGCAPPTHEPKVSETIDAIVALIQSLIAKGHAYAVETPKGNEVYFGVRSFDAYGKLSHRKIDDLLSGARIEVGDVKRDPLDFALWKASGEGAWGWASPWGTGRPGWHIECSAMSAQTLGPHFDIHGGGMDLIFPHHENEIAQSEAAHGPDLARYWMHAGFLTLDREKMSKSLGNFVTVRDILARNDAEALRYYFLGAHYRGPLNFDLETREDGRVVFPNVDEAERRVDYLYNAYDSLVTASTDAAFDATFAKGPLAELASIVKGAKERVLAALDDDLNSSIALSIIGELAKAGNEIVLSIARLKKDPAEQAKARVLAGIAAKTLRSACEPLGLMQATSEEYAHRTREKRLAVRGIAAETIDTKVLERVAARTAKDFARSDAIRAELASLGIELADSPGSTTWRVTA